MNGRLGTGGPKCNQESTSSVGNVWMLVPFHTTNLGQNSKGCTRTRIQNTQEIESYIKQLMAIQFLLASLINATFSYLQMPSLGNLKY